MTDSELKNLKEELSQVCPLFFKTFTEARNSQKKILDCCGKYRAVYLVIEEEGDMDDMTLLSLHKAVKVYAGSAWSSIHKRRLEDGLYSDKKV